MTETCLETFASMIKVWNLGSQLNKHFPNSAQLLRYESLVNLQNQGPPL